MAKDQIWSNLGECKSVDPAEIVNCLKNRKIRLFKNTVTALYGEGPYILSPPYPKNYSLSVVMGKI